MTERVWTEEERFAAAAILCKLGWGEDFTLYDRSYQDEEIRRVMSGRGISIPAASLVDKMCELTAAKKEIQEAEGSLRRLRAAQSWLTRNVPKAGGQ